MKALKFSGGVILFALFAFQLWSLPRFPAINLDEVGFAAMSNYFLKTGSIFCPLGDGVINPNFRLLSGVSEAALRGVYLGLLGLWQLVAGRDYVGLRLISFVCWALTGGLLWKDTNEKANGTTAFVALVLWLTSIDGILASHLIRPEAPLALVLYVVVRPYLRGETMGPRFFLFAGVASTVAAIGIHPNALAIVGAAGLITVGEWRAGTDIRKTIVPFVGGACAGALAAFMLVDFEMWSLSTHTFFADYFKDSSHEWIDRLMPWKLIFSGVGMFAKPNTFYLTSELRHPIFWTYQGMFQFMAYALSGYWVARYSKNRFVRRLGLLGGFLFLVIGYGAFRPEKIYLLPLTMAMAPCVAASIAGMWEELRSKGSTPPTAAVWGLLVLCAATSGAFGLAEQVSVLQRTVPFYHVLDAARKLVPNPSDAVLGPDNFWFLGQARFGGTNSISTDYYYSGKRRTRECIGRFRPDVLIVDEPLVRRDLVGVDPATRRPFLKPIETIVAARVTPLGALPADEGKIPTMVYKLDWSAVSDTTSGKSPRR